MTFANYTNDRRTIKQGRVLGCFNNSEFSTFFEYSERPVDDVLWAMEHVHLIHMTDGTTRYATIKKTVAHIVVDETSSGQPVVESWAIKRHRKYP